MDIDEIRSKAKRKGVIAGGIWLIVFGLIPLLIWIVYKPDTFFKAISNRDFYGWLEGYLFLLLIAYVIFYALSYYGTKKKLMEDEKTREDNELREKMIEFLDRQNQTNK